MGKFHFSSMKRMWTAASRQGMILLPTPDHLNDQNNDQPKIKRVCAIKVLESVTLFFSGLTADFIQKIIVI